MSVGWSVDQSITLNFVGVIKRVLHFCLIRLLYHRPYLLPVTCLLSVPALGTVTWFVGSSVCPSIHRKYIAFWCKNCNECFCIKKDRMPECLISLFHPYPCPRDSRGRTSDVVCLFPWSANFNFANTPYFDLFPEGEKSGLWKNERVNSKFPLHLLNQHKPYQNYNKRNETNETNFNESKKRNKTKQNKAKAKQSRKSVKGKQGEIREE